MRLIIILFFVILNIGCAQDSGSNELSTPTIPDEQVQKICTGNIKYAWQNLTTNLKYELNSDCTGTIPSCELEFEWDYIEQINNYKGTISINVTKVTPAVYCPDLGKTTCKYNISSYGATILNMSLECDGYFPANFKPLHSVE